jgi:hypothetical protein
MPKPEQKLPEAAIFQKISPANLRRADFPGQN